ncbi:MAG: aminotransferase [Actinomycetota bacterium]|nr:aminotransferase [Actinomycetota bacterium]
MTQHAPRALIIYHEDAVSPGFVGTRLAERGVDFEVHVTVPDQKHPDRPAAFPDHAGYDLIVPMGSAWSVYDHSTIGSWIDDEIELLRRAHHDGVSVLGICFGGQALAKALGGSVEPAETTEIGWYEITSTDGPLPISAGPWLEWHHDCFTTPPASTLLATTPNAPQLFREDHSVGTQFHPEITVELAADWLSTASDEYLVSNGVDAQQFLRTVKSHEAANRANCSALIDWFLDDVARLVAPRPAGTTQ